MNELLRIESPPLRWIMPLAVGGFLLAVFVYALLQGETRSGWAGWLIAALFAGGLSYELRRQRSGQPLLVATESGLWIKDLDCLGEIPWSSIEAVERRPFSRRVELRLSDRRRWLGRLDLWRFGHSVQLLTVGKVGFSLRFTGWAPDEAAKVLSELRGAR